MIILNFLTFYSLLDKLKISVLFELRLNIHNLCRKNHFLRLTRSFFLLFLLFFLLLFFPLRNDEFIGGNALIDEVEVQNDKIYQQKSKDAIDGSTDPAHNKGYQVVIKVVLRGENGQRDDIEREMHKS